MSFKETVRAAVIQLTSTADRQNNLARADHLVRAAVADGAEFVLLPEKWNCLADAETVAANAEPLDGESLAWAKAIAVELGIDLVAGSIVERVANERNFNTSVHLTATGVAAASYRKLHLFDVEVEGSIYRESAHEQPGSELIVSELTGGMKFGMSICYDLRFPELYRSLALAGAELLTVPAAFTKPTTAAHWQVLLQARAIENQAFVLAANQVGEHAPGLHSGGHSLIVDPWGSVLAEVKDAEGYAIADLNRKELLEIRTKLPSLASYRHDIFASARPL